MVIATIQVQADLTEPFRTEGVSAALTNGHFAELRRRLLFCLREGITHRAKLAKLIYLLLISQYLHIFKLR
jgi:hypothetical protein